MPFQGLQHFASGTIVGGKKVGTDQQQDYLSIFQIPINFSLPFLTWKNLSVVPYGNEVFSLKLGK
jgi:hypothetical protein